MFSLDEEANKDYQEKEPIEEEKPKEDFTHSDKVQILQKGLLSIIHYDNYYQ